MPTSFAYRPSLYMPSSIFKCISSMGISKINRGSLVNKEPHMFYLLPGTGGGLGTKEGGGQEVCGLVGHMENWAPF